MDEMTQVAEVLSAGPVASLGSEEEQQALEVELADLLAAAATDAEEVPVESPPGLQGGTSSLPAAPATQIRKSSTIAGTPEAPTQLPA